MSDFIDENLRVIRPLLGIGIAVFFIMTLRQTRFGRRIHPASPSQLLKNATLYGRFHYHRQQDIIYFKHEPLMQRILLGRSSRELHSDPEAFQINFKPDILSFDKLDGKWGFFKLLCVHDGRCAVGSAFVRYKWYHLWHAKV